ncbi:MAG: hypothetical protein IPH82_26275 [Chloroflexi bacterium]|nr:hypothetical protein [Chloroflexota bacterium]
MISIWLSHIISVYNHRMDRVQEWAATHQVSLRQLTGQNVTELDFTDDRLAICLRELHEPDQWRRIESLLGNRVLRVYDLRSANTVRLDGTSAGCITTRRVTRCFRWGRTKKGSMSRSSRRCWPALTRWACCWRWMWRLAIGLMTRYVPLLPAGERDAGPEWTARSRRQQDERLWHRAGLRRAMTTI